MSNTTTDKTLNDVVALLADILAELKAKPAAPIWQGKTQTAASSPTPTGDVPQPTELVGDPGAVEIHFGKNTGKRIDDLSDNSLAWYAQDQVRLKNDGTPFPPREQDTKLRNACRQLWHDKKGTLRDGKGQSAAAPKPAARLDDEAVPF